MRQKALYPAILATAFLMMVIISGLATTPTLYRQMVLAQTSSPAPAHTAASPARDNSAPAIDLQALSTLTLLGTSLNLILRGPRQPRAMIGPSDGAPRLFDPATPGLRGALRSVFLHWLLVRAAGFELTMWLLRRFLKRHYSAPLTTLVDSIKDFSDNPAVAIPIPDAVTSSPEFLAAGGALDSLQRITLIALRQRERLANIGKAVTTINYNMRNVLSSATLVSDTLIASEDPRVRRAACRALAGTVDHSLPVDDRLSYRNTNSRTGHHHDALPCRQNRRRC